MKNIAGLTMGALLLVACGTDVEETPELKLQTGEPETISVEDAGEVHLSFSEKEVTLTVGDSIEVLLENDMNETLSMGRHYSPEFYKDGNTWTEIPIPVSFTEDIVLIESGDEFLFDVMLLPETEEDDAPNFESGLYRVRKEFGLGEEGPINTHEISVMFDLEVE